MRASMDSMRPTMRAPMTRDSAGRAQMRTRMEQMRTQMRQRGERLMEQVRTDRRDAIAVLTPDQQAQAWEMIQARPRGAGFARFAPGFGARGFGGGRSVGPGGPGARRTGPPSGPRRPRRNDDDDGVDGE
jgi:hypothetical protein